MTMTITIHDEFCLAFSLDPEADCDCRVSFPERCERLENELAVAYGFAVDDVDIDALIREYCSFEGNSCGGSLHVVLDDGNIERSTVAWCEQWATERGDECGAALARVLLALDDDQRAAYLAPHGETVR